MKIIIMLILLLNTAAEAEDYLRVPFRRDNFAVPHSLGVQWETPNLIDGRHYLAGLKSECENFAVQATKIAKINGAKAPIEMQELRSLPIASSLKAEFAASLTLPTEISFAADGEGEMKFQMRTSGKSPNMQFSTTALSHLSMVLGLDISHSLELQKTSLLFKSRDLLCDFLNGDLQVTLNFNGIAEYNSLAGTPRAEFLKTLELAAKSALSGTGSQALKAVRFGFQLPAIFTAYSASISAEHLSTDYIFQSLFTEGSLQPQSGFGSEFNLNTWRQNFTRDFAIYGEQL